MYRFFMVENFEGWIGEIPNRVQIGQLMFTGSAAHAPSIAWSRVCKKEGATGGSTVTPTTGESTTTGPPLPGPISDNCENLKFNIVNRWTRGFMKISIETTEIENSYDMNDFIQLELSGVATFDKIWSPFSEAKHVGGNQWRYGF